MPRDKKYEEHWTNGLQWPKYDCDKHVSIAFYTPLSEAESLKYWFPPKKYFETIELKDGAPIKQKMPEALAIKKTWTCGCFDSQSDHANVFMFSE